MLALFFYSLVKLKIKIKFYSSLELIISSNWYCTGTSKTQITELTRLYFIRTLSVVQTNLENCLISKAYGFIIL